ncbi:MAG: DISARM system SNF2-like helicase DrmD [Candidatus Obscuribacterales bacterium]|nr:DISARM system SNF2-like helicase DrmD [Candidatus Obscuribacterales bacterium]
MVPSAQIGILPAPGQIARVRQRLYLVDEVVPKTRPSDSTLVKLSCLDDDNQGQLLEVLWEREIDAQVISAEDWQCIAKRGFDKPKMFAAFFNTLRWNCVTATDPKLFQSPFRSGIRIDAYQLEPLRKALLLPRVNLFIADDVGLGKTIEAGLIARELLLRRKVKEIVVSCPPSMLLQWKEELESRFGLTFEILDRDYLSRIRRERGFGVNAWSTHSRFLISHRLLIDENYTGTLRDWLGTLRSGSLFIFDEAHAAAPSSGQKYAVDSLITKAIRDLAPRFEHRLFLSATPHNGHSNSFSALLELLDPQRFCRGVPVEPKMLDKVLVRRLKEDLREIVGGLPKRTVEAITIDGLPETAPELTLAQLLDEYRKLREERLSSESKKIQNASGLLISGLQQRLLSSVEAFAKTLHVHRKTVRKQWENLQQKSAARTALPMLLDLVGQSVDADDERLDIEEAQLQLEESEQIEVATAATMGATNDGLSKQLFEKEQRLLDEMTEVAETYRGKPDARVKKLIEWIKNNMCSLDEGSQWNNTRMIIFTEWEDTRRYLQQQLEYAIENSSLSLRRIAVFHGQTAPRDRDDIKKAFNTDPKKHPVRILIATDAAREGLNLQAHCWNLFHFDVPWNPSRMEQRNGRIDRKLQPKEEVICHYFVYSQRPEDRILQALVRKTETIKDELGSLSKVVEVDLHKKLEQGIRRTTIADLERAIKTANVDNEKQVASQTELESTRKRKDDLRIEIATLENLLAASRENIGLNKDQFKSAISCALELMESKPLEPCSSESNANLETFAFPELDRRDGADVTWTGTMDTLRPPRKRDEMPWEWRRAAVVRPVVFEEPESINDNVVHLHLEHRVVQRLLSRFNCQGFIYKDLSRACLAQTKDSIPRVILLGRLCLYGNGAARLHEELVPITARWVAPEIRKQPLSPYATDAETRTLQILNESLIHEDKQIDSASVERYKAAAPKDVEELLQYLEERGNEYALKAEEKLLKRAEAESKAMRELLERQKQHIQNSIAKYEKDAGQKKIQFLEEEFRQLESNRKHWDNRLEYLEKELLTEPNRVRQVYEVKARRIEPVGLVYLYPAKQE